MKENYSESINRKQITNIQTERKFAGPSMAPSKNLHKTKSRVRYILKPNCKK